jgi:arginine/lysine/ornithine decarboxylase
MTDYLLDKLMEYGASDAYPLHMPGHKRQMRYFADPYAIDITEIEGFDNLHHAEGILLAAQLRAAQLYGSEETHYLINGSTGGILAAVAAAVPRGGRILMARNCHKAAYHAALLNGLQVTYLYPEMDMLRRINSAIRPEEVERVLREQPEIRAVLLTSPTYDGIASDVRRIGEIVHRAGCILIVDEAHGAHFVMHPAFPESAVACGADLVINSLHKTMPSLTQTALLHVNGPLVDRKKLCRYLGIYQTSSPSYVLMAGMDACIRQMQEQGMALFDEFYRRLEAMRTRLETMQVLHLVNGRERELYAWGFDPSKVLISTEASQMDGPELAAVLREHYGLEVEMAAERYVTAIMTVCDSQEGFDRLERALLETDRYLAGTEPSGDHAIESERNRRTSVVPDPGSSHASALPESGSSHAPILPRNTAVMSMSEAEDCPMESVPLSESMGRIAGEFVYLYPPGIPLLVPGEQIPQELPGILERYRQMGLKLQGMEDYSGSTIRVL